MNKKLKLMTVVGTRPEIIRLSEVIKAIDRLSDSFEQTLVHTGQNYDYELNEIFFEDLSLRKPDYFLNAAAPTALATIGQILIEIEKIIDQVKPDAFLVLGDTNSALSAIAAKRKKIPIFHMEAGNRSFDERVPEETNRRIVDHIADINLPYSRISRDYLIQEGLPPDRIIKTGSPMKEVIDAHIGKINASKILTKLALKPNQYFLVSAHREENVDDPSIFKDFIATLNMLASSYGFPVIVSTHPRTRKIIEREKVKVDALVQFLKPLGFSDYNALQKHALTVLSDSGTINEETSILGLKALNIRQSHERPEAMEEASTILVGLNPEKVKLGLNVIMNQAQSLSIKEVSDYQINNVSEKVVRLILSYFDYGIKKH
jgi:UDP-N-acetylglucosamine 2-epimerase